jgi:Dihydropteroate synthase (EC 2.5.1.15)
MGILNLTPDSFSDGGKFKSSQEAIDYALRMIDDGADIIDVGGESSRPGSNPVSSSDEEKRVIPVIEGLAKRFDNPISIDTYKSTVAEMALKSGAEIVNDISGLNYDPDMASTVATYGASLVAMHMKGTPRTMQENPEYSDLIKEVTIYLSKSIEKANESGIKQIIIDPGIGFGKTVYHNLSIIRHLKDFSSLGYPILTGPSRKSFIGDLLDLGVEDRIEGTSAAVAACVMNGADIVRVHDVKI